MKKVAKFDIQDLLPIGLTVAVTAIAIAYALEVQGEVADETGEAACAGFWNSATDVCQVNSTNTTALSGNPAEYNGSIDGINAVATVTDKLGLVVTVIMAAVIIGILIRYLSVR